MAKKLRVLITICCGVMFPPAAPALATATQLSSSFYDNSSSSNAGALWRDLTASDAPAAAQVIKDSVAPAIAAGVTCHRMFLSGNRHIIHNQQQVVNRLPIAGSEPYDLDLLNEIVSEAAYGLLWVFNDPNVRRPAYADTFTRSLSQIQGIDLTALAQGFAEAFRDTFSGHPRLNKVVWNYGYLPDWQELPIMTEALLLLADSAGLDQAFLNGVTLVRAVPQRFLLSLCMLTKRDYQRVYLEATTCEWFRLCSS